MAVVRGRSRAARLREWRAQLVLRTRLERRIFRSVNAELKRTSKEAAAAFKSGGKRGLNKVMTRHRSRMRGIMLPAYKRILTAFGERTLGSAKSVGVDLKVNKDEANDFQRLAREWIKTDGAKRVVRITTATESRIRSIVDRSLGDDLTLTETARKIREGTGGSIAGSRAMVISRTEIHTASMVGDDAAVEALDLDVELTREWIAVEDDRTRPTHKAANGQTQKPGDKFNVGAAKLRFPGDPSGPPEEVIQCRCVLAHVVPD